MMYPHLRFLRIFVAKIFRFYTLSQNHIAFGIARLKVNAVMKFAPTPHILRVLPLLVFVAVCGCIIGESRSSDSELQFVQPGSLCSFSDGRQVEVLAVCKLPEPAEIAYGPDNAYKKVDLSKIEWWAPDGSPVSPPPRLHERQFAANQTHCIVMATTGTALYSATARILEAESSNLFHGENVESVNSFTTGPASYLIRVAGDLKDEQVATLEIGFGTGPWQVRGTWERNDSEWPVEFVSNEIRFKKPLEGTPGDFDTTLHIEALKPVPTPGLNAYRAIATDLSGNQHISGSFITGPNWNVVGFSWPELRPNQIKRFDVERQGIELARFEGIAVEPRVSESNSASPF